MMLPRKGAESGWAAAVFVASLSEAAVFVVQLSEAAVFVPPAFALLPVGAVG
jgi:hypothetical protein